MSGNDGNIPMLKRSPGAKKKPFRHSDSESDTDGESEENSSVAGFSNNLSEYKAPTDSSSNYGNKLTPTSAKIRKGRRSRSQKNDWEIVEGLKDGQKCEKMPEKYEGYLSKKKRWPMKGWHKRYFVLERGILYYGKSPNDIKKGKYHGVIDIGLSVLAFKKHRQRIDIDAEELVYHIKTKQKFDEWLQKLRHHRLYRQHEIAYGTKESPRLTEIMNPNEDMTPLMPNMNFVDKARDNTLHRELSRHPSIKGQERVATWLLDTQGFEQCNKALSTAQNLLYELNKDLESIKNLPLSTDSGLDLNDQAINDKKKTKSYIGRSNRKKDHRRNASLQDTESIPSQHSTHHGSTQATSISQPPTPQITNNTPPTFTDKDLLRSSASNPNLHSEDRPRPLSAPMVISQLHELRIEELKLREGFLQKANQVHGTLRALYHSVSTERDRLRQSIEADKMATTATLGSSHSGTSTLTLKQTLSEVLQQNKILKAKLAKIHNESSVTDLQSSSPPVTPTPKRMPTLTQSFSAESCSISEYYDAVEDNNVESLSDSSSERSDEEISSDISDDNDTEMSTAHSASEENILTKFHTGRRSKLPVPKPDKGDVSLWNLLFRNIGKDLTKISMPVTLNEPLSMLQRLCEELEYSDLLDKAIEYDDPYERMIYVAAFAVSAYASSCYRVGHKPFNPILGETYESIREDKGWRFVSEQVSHHPPISACFCDSKNFTLWQDVQIKTKFWGKSMEIQPLGLVNVQLPKYKDHYTWNKVTTCVHSILGGQRWVDQFGEMTITNGSIVCKLTFTKSRFRPPCPSCYLYKDHCISNKVTNCVHSILGGQCWVDQFGEMTITNGSIVCKLTFTKASHYYQADKRHEVYGSILNPEGKVVHNLFGKWNEAMYCGHAPSVRCIWRPGAMPEDYELYYGFSRFAMELNELLHDETNSLPHTDSRFRPDQRLLEEGRLDEAEKEKLRVEGLQRDRRKHRESLKEEYRPIWFKKSVRNGKESYNYDHKYWESKKDPGFMNMTLPKLW